MSWQQNASRIAQVLRSEGFSPVAISGALARMRQESNFNPKAINRNDAGPGNHSQGIFQWNRGRLAALKRFAKRHKQDWQDVETQARFFAEEVRTTEKRWGNKLLNARTPEEAAEAAISLARPAGWKSKSPRSGHGWDNTINWTRNLAGEQRGELTLYARNPEADVGRKQGRSDPGGILQRILEMDFFGDSPEEESKIDLPDTGGEWDFSEFIMDPASVTPTSTPIDNSPMSVLTQTMTGLASLLGDAQENPGFLQSRFAGEMQAQTRQSPSVHSIRNWTGA